MAVTTSYIAEILKETSWKLDSYALCAAFGPAVINDSPFLHALVSYAGHHSEDLSWEEAVANIKRTGKLRSTVADIATAMANQKQKRKTSKTTNHDTKTSRRLKSRTEATATAASSPESTIYVRSKNDPVNEENGALREQTPIDLSSDSEDNDAATDHLLTQDDVLTFRGCDWVSTRAMSTILKRLFVRRDISSEIVVSDDAIDNISIPNALIARLQRLPLEPVCVPILCLSHWFSLQISLAEKRIAIMNSKWSLGDAPLTCADALGRAVAARITAECGTNFEVVKEDVPQQTEDTECAIHTLVNMLRATCRPDKTLTTTHTACKIWRILFRHICGDFIDVKNDVIEVLNIETPQDKHDSELIGLTAKELARERDKVLISIKNVSSTRQEMQEVLMLVRAVLDHLGSSLVTLQKNTETSKEYQQFFESIHDAFHGLRELRTSSDNVRYGVPPFTSLKDSNGLLHLEHDRRWLKHELSRDKKEANRLKKSIEVLHETRSLLQEIDSDLDTNERLVKLRHTHVTKALQERKVKLEMEFNRAKEQKRKLDEEAAAAEEAAQRAAKRKKQAEEQMCAVLQDFGQCDKDLAEIKALMGGDDGLLTTDGE